ncbi:AAA family ATPase [Sulfurospirillum multivorans]|uniref:Nuclease, SbcC-like n=2 Tax=Sulfurospirillum multivorans TaxID=66821 RepID=A0AA86ALA5_SULMK|nr:SMC family ATPase [Sulfurospirillum multivorans]AHJ12771.1 putative nuclease, SbcC-like [Sulfurospirillum multivorans DSM 12446]QEH06266.1 putative nuclease, SbcC-like [Sulfurospirillum multivorans]
MILSKLHLENFKRYTSFDIEFGEGLIGIIGKNGSGKSTLFEAILFALYGELKNRKYKEVIRNASASDKDAVLVELDFEFEGIAYKVIREFRGKALNANAKLYKNGELTTSGAREVTVAITKLTKMSKEAFLHTLFASQKELTSLSTLKNEDRKKMIRKLLGLEKIDFVENELIEKSRELKRDIAASAEFLLGEEELKSKTALIKETTAIKQAFEKEVKSKSTELETTKKQELHVKQELELFVKTKEQKQKLISELSLIKNSITSNLATQTKLTEELKNLEIKAKELKGLSTVKKEYESLSTKLKEQENLKNIQIKKEGLEKEQTQLRAQYTKAKADIAILEEQTKPYETLLGQKKENEALHVKLKTELAGKQTEQKQLQNELSAEQRIVLDTQQKIAKIQSLGRESNCPTCTRQLLDEYDNVIASLNDIVQKTQTQKIDKTKEKLDILTKQIEQLEKEKEQTQKALHVNETALSLIASKQKDLASAKEHFTKVSEQGKRNKDELDTLSKHVYDEALHVSLQKSFLELKPKYEAVLSLEAELKREQGVREDLALTVKSAEALHVKAKEKELEVSKTLYDEPKHTAKQSEYDELQKQKEKQYSVISELKEKIAKHEGEIKTLQNALENNDIQLKKVQSKKDDLQDYEKIKLSLSEFKTKLNSKIAPRISQIASQMYATITKGKYQYIEVNNDFDFFIYDEGKCYPIERFSGGEIDLANLVLRIAISKTLSELNGASSVGFLAFDEVFGSQDENRRMEILEAFHTIKEQYRQIFLISHEMEIKEMFERVVEL